LRIADCGMKSINHKARKEGAKDTKKLVKKYSVILCE
jgi:hypothetical protein